MGKRKVKWKDAKRMIRDWHKAPRNYDYVQPDDKWGEINRQQAERREIQRRREAEIAQERAQACINAGCEPLQRIRWDDVEDNLSCFRGCTISAIIALALAVIISLIMLVV